MLRLYSHVNQADMLDLLCLKGNLFSVTLKYTYIKLAYARSFARVHPFRRGIYKKRFLSELLLVIIYLPAF